MRLPASRLVHPFIGGLREGRCRPKHAALSFASVSTTTSCQTWPTSYELSRDERCSRARMRFRFLLLGARRRSTSTGICALPWISGSYAILEFVSRSSTVELTGRISVNTVIGLSRATSGRLTGREGMDAGEIRSLTNRDWSVAG